MNKLEADPRVTQGPNFFTSLIEWMKRAALAVNSLVDWSSAPTAPTPSNTDNSTKVATTAWVRSAMTTIMSALGFAFSASFTAGYLKLPSCLGGVIFQWGSLVQTTDGGGNTSTSYPIAFPNAVLAKIMSSGDADAAPGRVHGLYAQSTWLTSTTAIAFSLKDSSGAAVGGVTIRANYLVVGY